MRKASVATSIVLTPAGLANEVEARERTVMLSHSVTVTAAK